MRTNKRINQLSTIVKFPGGYIQLTSAICSVLIITAMLLVNPVQSYAQGSTAAGAKKLKKQEINPNKSDKKKKGESNGPIGNFDDGGDGTEENRLLFEIAGGAEVQGYFTGVIPGIYGSFMMSTLKNNLRMRHGPHVRVGYNIVRHRDLGEHEDERGGGPGATLGYRLFYALPKWSVEQNLMVGLRGDVWFNKINWKDNIDQPTEVTGTTKVMVIQPTLELGWATLLGRMKRFEIIPTIAVGMEINTNVRGADVGQGLILLVGVNGGYIFKRNWFAGGRTERF